MSKELERLWNQNGRTVSKNGEQIGRPKGVEQKTKVQKAKEVAEAEAVRTGKTPLEILEMFMNNEDMSPSFRAECARAAAPYVHKKQPQLMEHSGANGGPIQTEELSAARERLTHLLIGQSAPGAEDTVSGKPH